MQSAYSLQPSEEDTHEILEMPLLFPNRSVTVFQGRDCSILHARELVLRSVDVKKEESLDLADFHGPLLSVIIKDGVTCFKVMSGGWIVNVAAKAPARMVHDLPVPAVNISITTT